MHVNSLSFILYILARILFHNVIFEFVFACHNEVESIVSALSSLTYDHNNIFLRGYIK